MLRSGKSWVSKQFRHVNELERSSRRGRGANIGQLVEIENDAAAEANQVQPSLSSQLRTAIAQPNTEERFLLLLHPQQQGNADAAGAGESDADPNVEDEIEVAG